jgi:hypothetical protein
MHETEGSARPPGGCKAPARGGWPCAAARANTCQCLHWWRRTPIGFYVCRQNSILLRQVNVLVPGMSFQPDQDVDKEYPELFALKHRMMALRKRSPAVFWFRAWLLLASVALVVGTFEGPEGFLGAKGKAVLAISVLGWIYPFLIWVTENRDSKS